MTQQTEQQADLQSGTDTEIGFLPNDWNVSHLEEIAVSIDYGTSVKCDHDNDGVPVLRIPNVVGGKIDLTDLRNGNLKPNEIDAIRLQVGDLLFVRTNGVLQNAGRCSLFRGELEPCYFASYLIRVSVDASRALPAFVNEYARTELGRSFLSGQAIRTADGKFNINSGTLKRMSLPLPPLSEQRRIAGVLGLLQRAVEQQERLLALVAELKQTLLHHLFTHGLRGEPQKTTDLGPIPQSWEVVQFEDFALLQRGFDLPRSEFIDGPYPVIGATTTIGFHHKWNVKGPGVTVVRSGSSAGKPQFVKIDFWAHNVVLFVKDFHGHNPKFVYYKIQHLDLTKYREGVAVPTLNRNSFRAVPVAVPLREEQDEFVQVLDAVEEKEHIHRRKHSALTSLFRTLQHQLMTAQLRVSDLDVESLLSPAVPEPNAAQP